MPRTAKPDEFLSFHRRFPEVYRILEQRALRHQRRGQAFGVRAAFGLLRKEGWEINDHLSPRYARVLRRRRPELKRLIEVRPTGR